ncbi:hypothetical protein CDAR_381761 [Caerostris darwini]|uniref:Uncharacterized protein n=1 Tax=Caerostris darwini TaxID=1538125 RepID=A0AAV4V4S6_9ARAC|nr:hypothetical protein CDAR_381761 [Caerostris darwini]
MRYSSTASRYKRGFLMCILCICDDPNNLKSSLLWPDSGNASNREAAGAISFLKCIFSQYSISAALPSIAKWHRTEKEEEIEQNPRFIPSFHSPTLIPTTPRPPPCSPSGV